MRKFITAALFSLSFIPAFSQSSSIDSLKNVLSHANADTLKIRILNKLSEATMNSDPVQSIEFSKQSVNIINTGTTVPENLQAETYYQQSRAYHLTGNLANATSSAKMAFKLAHDQLLQCKICMMLGKCYFETENYPSALEYDLKGLQLAEHLADKNKMGSCDNNIALVYRAQSNYAKALEYFNRSRQLFAQANDLHSEAIAWENLGGTFSGWNKNDSAIRCYSEAEKILRKLNDVNGLANVLSNLGNAEVNSNSPDAFAHLNEALKLREQVNDKAGICETHTDLGKFFLKKYKSSKGADDLKKAEDHLKQAETIAKEINSIYSLKEISGDLSELYALKDDYRSAYNYLKQTQAMNDSLSNETFTRQIAEMQVRYELEKKQKELELLDTKTRMKQLELENTRLQKQVDDSKKGGFNTGH